MLKFEPPSFKFFNYHKQSSHANNESRKIGKAQPGIEPRSTYDRYRMLAATPACNSLLVMSNLQGIVRF